MAMTLSLGGNYVRSTTTFPGGPAMESCTCRPSLRALLFIAIQNSLTSRSSFARHCQYLIEKLQPTETPPYTTSKQNMPASAEDAIM